MRPWPALAIAGTLLALPLASAAAEITLYRCVDAKGKLTLRDTPCAKGEQQQTRTFQRPVDPPPRPAASIPDPTPAPAPAAPEVRYVTITPPRPMYECITPDGERYTSDDDAGNPRWVPLWTLGYPAPRHGFRGTSASLRPVVTPRPPPLSPPTHPHPVPPAFPVFPAAGTVIADECHPLPQEDICQRLNDRRWEIKRRYLNAMPSERAVLDDEERALLARLRNDCGMN